MGNRPKNIYSGYAFTGNPIVIVDDEPDFIGREAIYMLSIGDKEVYRGHYTLPLEANIAELCAPYINYFSEADCTDQTPAKEVLTGAALTACTMRAEVSNEYIYQAVLLPGGISKEIFRKLAEAGTDIFIARFLNHTRNFFFTLRGAGKILNLPEDETGPMYYLIDQTCEITISHDLDKSEFTVMAEPGVNAIDFGALRRYFANKHRIFPAVFHISIDRNPSITVVLQHSDPPACGHRLKYRNSLGVFDRFRLCTEPTVKLENSEEYDSEITPAVYNPITDDYTTIRAERTATRKVWEVSVPVDNAERLRLICDMICSTEVYLETGSGTIAVIPTADTLEWEESGALLTEIKLTLTAVESDSRILPDDFAALAGTQGVFTQEFTEEFT